MTPFLNDLALSIAVALPLILLCGVLSRRIRNDVAASVIDGVAFGLAAGWSTVAGAVVRHTKINYADAAATGTLYGIVFFAIALANRRHQKVEAARLPILALYGIVGAFVLTSVASYFAAR